MEYVSFLIIPKHRGISISWMLCIDGFNYEIQDNSKFLNINTNKIWQIITVYFIYKKNDLANNVPY